MLILQDSSNHYGDVRFTLTDEERSLLLLTIKNMIYNSWGDADTMLKLDSKLLLWLLEDVKSFSSTNMIYCNSTMKRIKDLLCI